MFAYCHIHLVAHKPFGRSTGHNVLGVGRRWVSGRVRALRPVAKEVLSTAGMIRLRRFCFENGFRNFPLGSAQLPQPNLWTRTTSGQPRVLGPRHFTTYSANLQGACFFWSRDTDEVSQNGDFWFRTYRTLLSRRGLFRPSEAQR